jgi:hypothetical protein
MAAVIPRAELFWQNYDLPPSPADDLPDLVHLQAQRDVALADDGEGFDFLPLAGDDQHSYHVLGVGVSPAQLARLRELSAAAELKLAHVLPEPLGWPELGAQLPTANDASLAVFAAISDRQAIVWATDADRLKLLRTIWLPADAHGETDAAALAGELRRTLMALAQSHHPDRPIHCVYCGDEAEEFSGLLSATLSKPVQAAPLEDLIEWRSRTATSPTLADVAPLAAIAAGLALGRPARLDLLHPRRRPAPPSRTRTYVLAGVAGVLLAAALAWQAYRNLQAPLEAAARAAEEQNLLKPILEKLAADEVKSNAVAAWLDDSTNLLTEVDRLGQQLRPQPLDSKEFNADEDLVLTKLVVARRELTLSAAVKSTAALQPVERRLRAADYRVERGTVEANEQAVPGYGVAVSAVVERTEAPSTATEAGP